MVTPWCLRPRLCAVAGCCNEAQPQRDMCIYCETLFDCLAREVEFD